MTNLECVILIYQTMLRGAEDARFTLGKFVTKSVTESVTEPVHKGECHFVKELLVKVQHIAN